MKNPIYPLLPVALIALVAGCNQSQTPHQAGKAAATPEPEGPVVATVNGAPIMKSVVELYAAQRNANGKQGEKADDQAILNELISLELMRQEAISEGLENTPVVVATLNQQTRTLLAGAAIREFIKKHPVTDAQVKALYDEGIGKPTTEYNASHILVKTREEAEEIIHKLDNGADFATLAKEKSTDTSAPDGGSLGWFSTAQMVQPFADAVAGLKKGSYTKEPVHTEYGWHVILLEDTRQSTPPAFDDIKDRLKVLVANQELQQHIKQIREKAKIEISDK